MVGRDWGTEKVQRRTAGEGIFVALIGSLAVGLVVSVVWYVDSVVRPVVDDFASMVSCSDSEWRAATDMSTDAAVVALADRFAQEREPTSTCDPDDGTAATDVTFTTGLTRSEALMAATSEMRSHGWSSTGPRACFTKGSGSSQLWAYFTLEPGNRERSNLGLSVVNANYCVLSNVGAVTLSR